MLVINISVGSYRTLVMTVRPTTNNSSTWIYRLVCGLGWAEATTYQNVAQIPSSILAKYCLGRKYPKMTCFMLSETSNLKSVNGPYPLWEGEFWREDDAGILRTLPNSVLSGCSLYYFPTHCWQWFDGPTCDLVRCHIKFYTVNPSATTTQCAKQCGLFPN